MSSANSSSCSRWLPAAAARTGPSCSRIAVSPSPRAAALTAAASSAAFEPKVAYTVSAAVEASAATAAIVVPAKPCSAKRAEAARRMR